MAISNSKGDAADEGQALSPYTALPKWQPRPEPKPPEVYCECKCCHEPHRFTRLYRVPTIIFAIFMNVWQLEDYVYCPRCMRLHLALYLLPNLLISTLAFPCVLATWGWTFMTTFSRRPYSPERDYRA